VANSAVAIGILASAVPDGPHTRGSRLQTFIDPHLPLRVHDEMAEPAVVDGSASFIVKWPLHLERPDTEDPSHQRRFSARIAAC
jgi:hypothetical protein